MSVYPPKLPPANRIQRAFGLNRALGQNLLITGDGYLVRAALNIRLGPRLCIAQARMLL